MEVREEGYLKGNLVELLNRLKIFKDEASFRSTLNELVRFVEEKEITVELLGEVLGGFIVERCDNMLANISFNDGKLRRYVYELSLEAFKLWLYSILQHVLKKSNTFTKYTLEFKGELKIESNSMGEIRKKIEEEIIHKHLKRSLSGEGVKLSTNILIDNVERFKELLPLIEQALNEKLIKLILIPNIDDFLTPLFFKEYYLSTANFDKVKHVAIAIERIIKRFKPYFGSDAFAFTCIENMERIVRNILGAESLDKYIISKDYEDYIVEVIRKGRYVHLKLVHQDNIICEAHEWQTFGQCVSKALNISYVQECMWQILYRESLFRNMLGVSYLTY